MAFCSVRCCQLILATRGLNALVGDAGSEPADLFMTHGVPVFAVELPQSMVMP